MIRLTESLKRVYESSEIQEEGFVPSDQSTQLMLRRLLLIIVVSVLITFVILLLVLCKAQESENQT